MYSQYVYTCTITNVSLQVHVSYCTIQLVIYIFHVLPFYYICFTLDLFYNYHYYTTITVYTQHCGGRGEGGGWVWWHSLCIQDVMLLLYHTQAVLCYTRVLISMSEAHTCVHVSRLVNACVHNSPWTMCCSFVSSTNMLMIQLSHYVHAHILLTCA